jgi:hypothetical protein
MSVSPRCYVDTALLRDVQVAPRFGLANVGVEQEHSSVFLVCIPGHIQRGCNIAPNFHLAPMQAY